MKPASSSRRESGRGPRCPRHADRSRPSAAVTEGNPSPVPRAAPDRQPPWVSPSPTGPSEQVWTFFYYLPSRLEDLDATSVNEEPRLTSTSTASRSGEGGPELPPFS